MRQRRSGPGSPDHIRTSFPDQFFVVTTLRADAHNRCIRQLRQIHGRGRMLAQNWLERRPQTAFKRPWLLTIAGTPEAWAPRRPLISVWRAPSRDPRSLRAARRDE